MVGKIGIALAFAGVILMTAIQWGLLNKEERRKAMIPFVIGYSCICIGAFLQFTS